MTEQVAINDQITSGAQPTAEEIRELARRGFRTVFNLRAPGEENQPLSPYQEEDIVRKEGMEYLHISVSVDNLHLNQMDEFTHALLQLPAPIFVHSGTGRRAGLFSLLHAALEEGWTDDEVCRRAEQRGFLSEDPQIRKFIHGYCSRRR